MVRHEFLEVTTTAEIESDAHYLEELSRFNIQATQHEARVIQEQFGLIDNLKKKNIMKFNPTYFDFMTFDLRS